ncbi:MAG: hypothetical protein JO143_09235 [Acetobacteraceae bacterium]|nr:hypothetical protein [Acetobacteraceae bacterium]
MTKIRLLTAAVAFGALGSLAASPPANAIGCISGGIAGAAAGHLANHGVLGAIGGCIAGHEANKYQKRRAAARAQNQDSMSNPAQTPQDSGTTGTMGSTAGTMGGSSTGTAR